MMRHNIRSPGAYLRGKCVAMVLILSPVDVIRDHVANERAAFKTSPLRG
jgi:hypothetical protein